MPLQTTLPMELLGAVCTCGRAVIVHSYTHMYIVHAHTCTLSAPLAQPSECRECRYCAWSVFMWNIAVPCPSVRNLNINNKDHLVGD